MYVYKYVKRSSVFYNSAFFFALINILDIAKCVKQYLNMTIVGSFWATEINVFFERLLSI